MKVKAQIASANQPQTWGMVLRKSKPVMFAIPSVETVYIPMGKTRAQLGGS